MGALDIHNPDHFQDYLDVLLQKDRTIDSYSGGAAFCIHGRGALDPSCVADWRHHDCLQKIFAPGQPYFAKSIQFECDCVL